MRKLLALIFRPMAQIEHKPIPTDDQVAALEAIKAYKKQNPAKYELKKAALFKKYGLSPDAEVEEAPDASDIELEAITKKVKRNAK
jgi:hypothetical protein